MKIREERSKQTSLANSRFDIFIPRLTTRNIIQKDRYSSFIKVHFIKYGGERVEYEKTMNKSSSFYSEAYY